MIGMISTYYFRAQMYTLVPHQVREDMRWMADHGSDAVIVGVMEQDFRAARENLDLICAEAAKAGLRVLATPSRWGNLVAGCPKVPSILCATRHEVWARNADGSPAMNFLGPIAMFLFGHYADMPAMNILAGTPGLDDFGLDGRPWAREDGGVSDSGSGAPSKFLLDQGPSFIAAARAHGRHALALIENHALNRADTRLMEKRLDAVLAQGYDHLIYYYYPRSCEDAERAMAILGQAIRRYRAMPG